MKLYRLLNKLGMFFVWGIVFPLTLFIAALPVSLNFLYKLETDANVNAQVNHNLLNKQEVTYSSLTSGSKVLGIANKSTGSVKFKTSDYRGVVLDEFFRRNESPLFGLGHKFVEACDRYNAPFDCTTLPAIGYVETRLCTLDLSHEQRNCWGFGGSGPNRIWYKSYEDAIDMITDRLVNAYGPSYMTNPVSMQYTYCGPGCHAWGNGVQSIRYQINNLAIEMGYPPLIRN